MKKIVSILLVIVFLSSNFSFAQSIPPVENNCNWYACPQWWNVEMDTNWACNCMTSDGTNNWGAEPPAVPTTPAPTSSTAVMGISCSSEQLLNGQCKLNIYDTLGIRKSVRNPGDRTSVGLFVQDIVLSATFFIGTLVTIALVVSGLMFIFAASSGKDPTSAKQGIIGSLIGLLVVVSSYIIIRLVQYLARGF